MSVSEVMQKEDFNTIIDTYIGLGTIIGKVIRETSPGDMQGMKNRIQKLSIHCTHAKAVIQKRWEDLNNAQHVGDVPPNIPADAEQEGPGPADAEEA